MNGWVPGYRERERERERETKKTPDLCQEGVEPAYLRVKYGALGAALGELLGPFVAVYTYTALQASGGRERVSESLTV